MAFSRPCRTYTKATSWPRADRVSRRAVPAGAARFASCRDRGAHGDVRTLPSCAERRTFPLVVVFDQQVVAPRRISYRTYNEDSAMISFGWRRSGVRYAAATAALMLAVPLVIQAQASAKKPNIVMLMTDDTGWGDWGYIRAAAPRSATPRRTSTAWRRKAPTSRTGMARRAAPRGARRSSRAASPFARRSRSWWRRAMRTGCTRRRPPSPSSSRRTAIRPTSRGSGTWVTSRNSIPSSTASMRCGTSRRITRACTRTAIRRRGCTRGSRGTIRNSGRCTRTR